MNKIIIVNRNNEIVGESDLRTAIQQELIRRVVRVFLFNDKKEVLLQQRSAKKLLYPNFWENSVTGHVDVGETDEQAAARELDEEMRISEVELKKISTIYCEEPYNNRTLRRFEVIFVGKFNGQARIDPEETSDYRWVPLRDLQKELQEHKEEFTPGCIKGIGELKKWEK